MPPIVARAPCPPNAVKLPALLGAVLLATGCHGGSDLMPLDIGHSWNYIVKSGFDTYVTPVKVEREVSVANTRGVELTCTLGTSRMAWTGDCLVVERLAGTQFVPPLPLLFKTDETSERPWKGHIQFVDQGSLVPKDPSDVQGGPPRLSIGTQSQKADDDIPFAGKKIHCIRSTVRLKTAAHSIELITWFSAGLGIVQQEQRTDEKLLVRLTLLDAK